MTQQPIVTAQQPQNKPLSETHPTLWAKWIRMDGDTPEIMQMHIDLFAKDIQEFTVDIAEHNRVRLIAYDNLQEKVRLQKELQENKDALLFHENLGFTKGLVKGLAKGERRAFEKLIPTGGMLHQPSFHKGCEKGERRAMQKVEAGIVKLQYRRSTYTHSIVSTLELRRELGLDKEGAE